MKTLLHRVVHLLHWQRGYVETWWEPCDRGKQFMVGYRCATCGVVTGVIVDHVQRSSTEAS